MSGAAADLGLQTVAPASPAGGDTSQPEMTVQQAWERRAQLMRDPDFKARVTANEPNARAEMVKIGKAIGGGVHFELGVGVDRNAFGSELGAAIEQREALTREQAIEDLRGRAFIGDDVAQQIRDNRAVTREERHLAEQHKASLFANPDWVRRYYAGDPRANTELAPALIVLASPVKD